MHSKTSFDKNQLSEIIVSAISNQGLVNDKIRETLRKERGDKKIVVLAAAPKTGSTFLLNTLSSLTGYICTRLSAAYATNEHDLYLPALCLHNKDGCVSQMHMKGTFHNAHYLNVFDITPIILVRDIFDIIISLKKDLRAKEKLPYFDLGLNGYSFLWQDKATKKLDSEQFIDLIIDLAIPWYINFYVSWYRLCEQKIINTKWVTYEELFSDKEKVLRDIMRFLGFGEIGTIDKNILSKKYSTYNSDKNRETSRSLLTDLQIEKVYDYTSHYKDIDFSKFGL
ncbi:MAG: hypothetical protein ED557_09275 [Balneola sp.]|nr:MAG: hypothetical protein ED557_09275 [Balneola sp.]